MPQLFTNNAQTTVVGAIGLTDTALTVAAGLGSLFSAPNFSGADEYQMLTLSNASATEIVQLTNRVGDVLTVVRAREGTTALSWAAGSTISARITAGMLQGLIQTGIAGVDALAVGSDFVEASGARSVAAGPAAYAPAASSLALGDMPSARAVRATAIGWNRNTQLIDAWGVHGVPLIPHDFNLFNYGGAGNVGVEGVITSPFAELGVPSAWAALTQYKDGDIVVPSTPNGFHYRIVATERPYVTGNFLVTTGATEPVFGTVVGAQTNSGVNYGAGHTHKFLCMDPAAGFLMSLPAGANFYASEVGFICFARGPAVSAAPFVFIGRTAVDPGAFASNVQLTQIAASLARHRITSITDSVAATSLHFKVGTPAVGGKFLGRFYARGMFVQNQ